MFLEKNISITNDSGFLSIVNADQYKSFVDEDWGYQQLMDHFVDQMKQNNLIIWSTGIEGMHTVSFLLQPSDVKPYREFSKNINVTNSRLYVSNYEDLTMAAQFEDEPIPSKHNSQFFTEVDNGYYNVTVRQLFNEDNCNEDGDIHFEIILEKVESEIDEVVQKVFWLDE